MKNKTLLALLPATLLLLPLSSCQKDEATGTPEKDIAFVTIRSFETRSQIGTNALPAWSEGERIAIAGEDGVPAEFVLRSGAGYSSASFEGIKPEGNLFTVYHPSSARCDGITYRGVLDSKIVHNVPDQTIGRLPMWGRALDLSEVSITCLCGILEFDMQGSGSLRSLLLDAGRPISGEFLCSIEDGLYALINGSNIILMDATGTELSLMKPTPFYFILPPGEYEGISISVTAADGSVTAYTSEEPIVIEAGIYTRVLADELDAEELDLN